MEHILDKTGLAYFWGKIKASFAKKTDVPTASTTTPVMDGTAAVGSSTAYARADHRHPSDDSKIAYGDTLLTNNNFISHNRLYQNKFDNLLYAANERWIVTHKLYDNSDNFVRDLIVNCFDGSYDHYYSGVDDDHYAVMYIGSVEEAELEEAGTKGGQYAMWTYNAGQLLISFYYSYYSENVKVEVYRAAVGSQEAGWVTYQASLNTKIATSNPNSYYVITNGTYPIAFRITYQGRSKDTYAASISQIEFHNYRTPIRTLSAVTKYPVPQDLYGEVTAPKFIKRGGTSSQFLKADGSVDSNSYATTSSVPTKVSQLTNDTGFIVGDDVVFAGDDDGQGVIAEGGDVNVIETVKVNGTALTPDANKAVNVVVPTSLSGLASDSTHRVVTDAEKTTWSGKQDALVSGTNIKTINNQDLLGSGNITIQGGSGGGGDENVIEIVKVNGTALTPDANKAVNITVPTPYIMEISESEGVITIEEHAFETLSNAISEGRDVYLKKASYLYALDVYTEYDLYFSHVSGEELFIDTVIVSSDSTAESFFNSLCPTYIGSTTNLGAGDKLVFTDASNNNNISRSPITFDGSTTTKALTPKGTWETFLQSFTESDPTVPSHVKSISTTDISNWNGKQAAISDLETIRSGAALGATALQSFTESDPTVPAWAKASSKPTYTASEVGALPDTTVIPAAPGTLNTTATTAQSTSSSEALSGSVTLHKVAKTGTYSDLIGKPTIPTVPTNVSAFTNDAGYITSASVVTIYSGSTTPSSSLGNNGDIYIQTS